MSRQILSKKSKDELNRSLLTLYQKLTVNLDAYPEKEEVKSKSPVPTDKETQPSDQYEK